MTLKRLPCSFSVCKVQSTEHIDFSVDYVFVSKTPDEISLVCPTETVPTETLVCEDGWNGFQIEGILDFSMVGVLARISGILAENAVSIFAISTYNTDYILVRSHDFEKTAEILATHGYTIR